MRIRHPEERERAIDFLRRIMQDESQPMELRARAAINILQQTTAMERDHRNMGGDAERFQARFRRG